MVKSIQNALKAFIYNSIFYRGGGEVQRKPSFSAPGALSAGNYLYLNAKEF